MFPVDLGLATINNRVEHGGPALLTCSMGDDVQPLSSLSGHLCRPVVTIDDYVKIPTYNDTAIMQVGSSPSPCNVVSNFSFSLPFSSFHDICMCRAKSRWHCSTVDDVLLMLHTFASVFIVVGWTGSVHAFTSLGG